MKRLILLHLWHFCLTEHVGWDYINLHCRDNDNKPVDWWVMIKPPRDDIPYLEGGKNFIYITSDTDTKWQPSGIYITSNSMLQHTLEPMYRRTYQDNLAVAAFNHKLPDPDDAGSTATGILMADDIHGVYITHTVPGFPIINSDRPSFPDKETEPGHMIACFTVELNDVNDLAIPILAASPNFTYISVPDSMKPFLTNWLFKDTKLSNSEPPGPIDFFTRKKIRAVVLARSPGQNECLYKQFARRNGIILDVYSQTRSKYVSRICGTKYGVRNIDVISIKQPDTIFYIRRQPNRAKFAVSTAAHWQTRGSGPTQYWTCFSNIDKEDKGGKGGLMTCINHYGMWLSFDNLKVKEPEC